MFTGGVKWSPAYAQAHEVVELWHIIIDYLEDKMVNCKRMKKLQERYSICIPDTH